MCVCARVFNFLLDFVTFNDSNGFSLFLFELVLDPQTTNLAQARRSVDVEKGLCLVRDREC